MLLLLLAVMAAAAAVWESRCSSNASSSGKCATVMPLLC
jgi:hypothetical protein